MIKPIGGTLWQWDSNRFVEIVPKSDCTITAVHFSLRGHKNAAVVDYRIDNGHYYADIPNVLLQSFGNVVVYVFTQDDKGSRTTESATFNIMARQKPDDYVYTETEVRDWNSLVYRIDQIEKNGVSDEQIETAVNKYLEENPIFEIDDTLNFENGVLSVNTTDNVAENNTLPITAAAVHSTVGNIEILLSTI